MSNLQWIFHFEAFHFLSQVHVREFCAYCIQSNESFTWYIKMKPSTILLASNEELLTYKLQAKRIGLCENDGTIDEEQFHMGLKERVSKTCDVFVKTPMVYSYFVKLGYQSVELLTFLPKKLKEAPEGMCMKFHNKCAQKTIYEIANYLRPALVPYLDTSVIQGPIKYVDNSYKYGDHKLVEPYYKSLEVIDLLRLNYPPPNVDSEHCTEGVLEPPVSIV